jgi:hypothetical protein
VARNAIAITSGRSPRRKLPQLWRGGLLIAVLWLGLFHARGDILVGPIFSDFNLTLDAGSRTEVLGPLFYSEETEETSVLAVPPLFSYAHDRGIDSTEFDVLYPALTYDRYGDEYRFQIFQVFNFAGGNTQSDTNKHRFSLFPFYLQQRSDDSSQNYTWVLPFYGRLQNRLFRDEVFFVMLPLYLQTKKRDVITDNYVFPLFHLRHGDGLKGWQLWPLVGHEHKMPTTRTNSWNDEVPVPGHDKRFVLWPFFLNQRVGIGSTNEEHTQAVIPLYSYTRSPLRDSTSVPFLLGVTVIDDREKKYHELGAPWPFVVFRRGETARTTRVWPFYSRATNEFLESTWYLWPVYKYNRVHSDPLDRDRMRILLFLYSDTIERNTEAGTARRRMEMWPLFVHRKDWNGNSRLQVLALIEPILPNNKSIERNYSPLWSLWRDEKNAQTGARSQSLLWNLYRRESAPDRTSHALLFGLVERSKTSKGTRWGFFYSPKTPPQPSQSGSATKS